MEPDKLLDWIVAIFVLLFIIVPLFSSIFAKKKQPAIKKQALHHKKQHREKKEIEHPKVEVPLHLNLAKPKKITTEKMTLKYGSLKQAVILSEILNRPYSED